MDTENCQNCGKPVVMMSQKGTGICSENCRKEILGEKDETRAQTDAGLSNILRSSNGLVPGSIR